jgi:hypothetical protein
VNDSRQSFCEQCGAQLAPEMRFCEACGKPVAPPAQPAAPSPSAAAPAVSADGLAAPVPTPSTAAPRPTNRGLFVVLALVGLVVVLGCMAICLFGLIFARSQPGTSGALPASRPPIAAATGAAAPITVPPSVPTQKSPSTLPTQPAPTPAPVQDANTLLTTGQAQVANLKGTRFTFERTDGSTTSKGSGWLQMPDRAAYTIGEGTERVIVSNQMWSRPDSTAAWTTEMSVGPLNNPIAWLQILPCVTSPRVMPASTASGETLSTLSFLLASNAATCVSAGSVQALSGEGTVVLRPQNDGIARLYYNLTFTGQQLRGGVNAPLQITVEFSEWNNGSLPVIQAPR